MSVQNVEIQPKHRGNGLSLKMYESLLNHLGEKYKGISENNVLIKTSSEKYGIS